MPVRKSLNHIPASPAKIVEGEAPMKQGIVAILRSDCERSKAGSIRRTISADMSSKKWLEQNGFLSPLKKIVSSEALVLPADSSSSSSSSSSSEGEEEYEEIPNQDDVWRSIQAQRERDQMQKPAQIQVWDSILTQKSENSLLPPPYVHPLVKRSASTLSDKSLEICTESLGSETGSDCFSCYSCSKIHSDEGKEDRERAVVEELKDAIPFEDLHVAKYRKSPVLPFPPPLPSISGGHGAALHMHPHRENGRLVLEAVSVPPRNYLHAQRKNGRLLLTLFHAPATSSTGNEAEEYEKMCDDMEEVDEDIHEELEDDATGGNGSYDDLEEEEAAEEKSVGKESEFVREQNFSLPSGMIRVHKSGLVMKKLMAVGNINPTWSKANESIIEEEVSMIQSFPLPPRVAALIPPPAAASFNSYEYFWRNKATISCGFINPMIGNKINGVKECGVLVKRNKTEQFVPHFRGCKEARRSLLIWEPYCIATS